MKKYTQAVKSEVMTSLTMNQGNLYYIQRQLIQLTLDPVRQAMKDIKNDKLLDKRIGTGRGKKILDRLVGKPPVSEDWQKKSGKNPEGGLNEKGRKSYERQNPGSDLKRPSKKVGNPRRASFCARMKGMKKKLTSSKTANDPDSRINKSLRAWNC